MSEIQGDIKPDVTKERLYEEFNSVVAETEKLLKTLAGAGSDKAGAMQASVAQGLADASERLARIREEALGQANAAARATDEYVHGSPWQAVGIVAALAGLTGLAVGYFIGRR
ncbi:MAG TPA: DUF883 family protein [Usitatibacter sp.]|nr:DUF883 family protein [Usitatibacter sp.]